MKGYFYFRKEIFRDGCLYMFVFGDLVKDEIIDVLFNIVVIKFKA
jgi:hypothetical protein